ncbi:MAG: ATP-dependent zinc metalloprotease FtsH [Pseudomonadota bacterium]
MDKRLRFSLWYFLFGIVFYLLLQLWSAAVPLVEVRYSDFRQSLATGNYADLQLEADRIRGNISRPLAERLARLPLPARAKQEDWLRFVTVRVDDPGLLPALDAAGIAYGGVIESHFWSNLLSLLLPLVFMIALWGFLFRRIGSGAGGMMNIGKSKAKVYVDKDIKISFVDVAGIDEAVEELREVVSFLTQPEQYTRLGGRLPKGVLLVGPPGTGKTLLARAVAGEAKVPFFSLSGSEFVEMFVGVGAARVRDLFEQAQRSAPCIIFIDELDALGRVRGAGFVGGNEEREQTLNQLLTEMDGFDPSRGVVLMAATNRPEILDPALLRAGRFDRHVVVDRPDIKGREAILRIHSRNVVLAAEVELAVIAARTPGFVGADLANIVNEAALLAARSNKAAVTMAELEEAIDRVLSGLQKKSSLMTTQEKHRVAIHEAGHAIIAASVKNADPLHKVSIIPRGISALGYTLQLPAEDRHLYTREELLDRIAVMLGGRAAEQLMLGDLSTGAADDLQKATQLARRLVTEFGMSERFGPVSFVAERTPFLPTIPETSRQVSEHIAREIDRELVTLLQQRYQAVLDLLRTRQPALAALARTLEEKESLDGQAVHSLLAQYSNGKAAAAVRINLAAWPAPQS